MSSLGYSTVPGASAGANANQILQPNIAGGATPSNAHFTNQYGSMVGGVRGCAGAGGSAAALAGHPGYNIVPTNSQSGGDAHRRGGKSKKRGNKRSGNKRSGNKRSGKCRCRRGGKSKKRSGNKRSGNKRNMRGGLGAFSPASFSGATPPYHQYMTNVPASNNFSVGGSLSPAMSGMANPAPITVFPNCPTK